VGCDATHLKVLERIGTDDTEGEIVVQGGHLHSMVQLRADKVDCASLLPLCIARRQKQLCVGFVSLLILALLSHDLARLPEEHDPRRLAVCGEKALQYQPRVLLSQHRLHRRHWHAELVRQHMGYVLMPSIERHPPGPGTPPAFGPKR